MYPHDREPSGITFCIQEHQCVACAICADLCPQDALQMGREDLMPVWSARKCNGCAICARQCPTGAIGVMRAAREPRVTEAREKQPA
jgi:Na+-translocating ferredoxin:NAD+ oxidoreductase RNF subunit RnfB